MLHLHFDDILSNHWVWWNQPLKWFQTSVQTKERTLRKEKAWEECANEFHFCATQMSYHAMTWRSLSWHGSLCHDKDNRVMTSNRSFKFDLQMNLTTKRCMIVKDLRSLIEWPYKLTKIDESRFVGPSIAQDTITECKRDSSIASSTHCVSSEEWMKTLQNWNQAASGLFNRFFSRMW